MYIFIPLKIITKTTPRSTLQRKLIYTKEKQQIYFGGFEKNVYFVSDIECFEKKMFFNLKRKKIS